MRLRLWQEVACWTPLSRDEVQDLLARNFANGSITAESFLGELRDEHHLTRARLAGTFTSAGSGTLLIVKLHVAHAIVLGLLGAFMMLGPLAALLLVLFVPHHQRQTEKFDRFLTDVVGVCCWGPEARAMGAQIELADPTAEGADAGAPASFAVRSTLEGATFRVKGRPATTRVTVSRRGLRFEREGRIRDIDWAAIRGVDVRDRGLWLAGVEAPLILDCAGHTDADLLWFAMYLETRHARWSPDAEARAQASRLRQLQQHT